MTKLDDAMRDTVREVRTREYAMKKKSFMRGSCWVAPTLPLGEDGRVVMRLYRPPSPFMASEIFILKAEG